MREESTFTWEQVMACLGKLPCCGRGRDADASGSTKKFYTNDLVWMKMCQDNQIDFGWSTLEHLLQIVEDETHIQFGAGVNDDNPFVIDDVGIGDGKAIRDGVYL